MHHFIRLLRFAFVSGIGLALDFALFLTLSAGGTPPFAANAAAGAGAVTFVYFASVRRIFSYQGGFLFGLFAAYCAYHAAGIAAASWAVTALAGQGVALLLAKLLILPVTFSANYLFMTFLTRSRPAGAERRAYG